jgi:hypothetical protein
VGFYEHSDERSDAVYVGGFLIRFLNFSYSRTPTELIMTISLGFKPKQHLYHLPLKLYIFNSLEYPLAVGRSYICDGDFLFNCRESSPSESRNT